MDYKFWILLLVCIVLFYMYHQIEDLKTEIQHLHNKTENIGDIEQYYNESKQVEMNKKMNSAINNILPNKIKQKPLKKNNIIKPEQEYTTSQSTSSILSATSTSKKSLEEVYSNQNVNEINKYNVNLDDVMDIIEQNHINKMDNTFKINVVEESKKEDNNDIFIESTDEKILENKLELNNEENEENEKNRIDEIKKNDEEVDNNKYNTLMNKNLDYLRKLATENNIDIEHIVNGKKKKKLKRELCKELAVH